MPHLKNPPSLSEIRLLLDAIRQLVRALRLSDREISQRLGISAAQLFVMHQLKSSEPMSLGELAAATFTDQSSVSTVVSRLVEQELVSRDRASDDARRLELRLTRSGKALLKRAPATVQERLIAAIERLPAKRRKDLTSSLRAIVEETGLSGSAPMFFEETPRPARSRAKR